MLFVIVAILSGNFLNIGKASSISSYYWKAERCNAGPSAEVKPHSLLWICDPSEGGRGKKNPKVCREGWKTHQLLTGEVCADY